MEFKTMSLILVEETGMPGESSRPAASELTNLLTQEHASNGIWA